MTNLLKKPRKNKTALSNGEKNIPLLSNNNSEFLYEKLKVICKKDTSPTGTLTRYTKFSNFTQTRQNGGEKNKFRHFKPMQIDLLRKKNYVKMYVIVIFEKLKNH